MDLDIKTTSEAPRSRARSSGRLQAMSALAGPGSFLLTGTLDERAGLVGADKAKGWSDAIVDSDLRDFQPSR